jgi:hypothetical protein
MKPLPNLADAQAMAKRGRRASLWSARKEACEELRDAATALLHNDSITDVGAFADRAKAAIARIEEVAVLMTAEFDT